MLKISLARRGLLGLLGLLVVAGTGRALGLPELPPPPPAPLPLVKRLPNQLILPVDEGIQQDLARLDALAVAGRWDLYVRRLGPLMAQSGLLPVDEGRDGFYLGVAEHLRQRYAALPPAGRAALEALDGPLFRAAYAGLQERPDAAACVRYLRRWDSGSLGDDAWERLGDLRLEAGEGAAALEAYRQALAHPDLDLPRARLGLKLAWAAALAGDPEAIRSAGETLGRLEAETLPLGGRSRTVAEARLALPRPSARPSTESFALDEMCGPALCERLADAQWARGEPVWGVHIMKQAPARERPPQFEVGSPRESFIAFPVPQPLAPFFPFFPQVRDGVVYQVADDQILAFDLGSGRLQPGFEIPYRGRDHGENREQLAGALLLDDASSPAGGAASPAAGTIIVSSWIADVLPPESWRGIPIRKAIPVRKLVAHDLATRRVRWKLDGGGAREQGSGPPRFSAGGCAAADQPSHEGFAAKASFPVPPIRVGEYLVAGASLLEGYINAYLVGVEPSTGRIAWKTWLASGQVETTMFGYYAREALVSPPCSDGRLVYCCTNLGAVACLRPDTGDIVWLRVYPQTTVEVPKFYFPIPRSIGWANQAPLVADGVLYVTPLDSEHLLAIEASTGKLLFSVPRSLLAAYPSHLLGVRDGRVVMTGRKALAVDARDGRPLFATQLAASAAVAEQPQGRGIIAGSTIFCPGAEAIHLVDLRSGRRLEDWPLDHPRRSGNLVPLSLRRDAQGQLVVDRWASVSEFDLNVYAPLPADRGAAR